MLELLPPSSLSRRVPHSGAKLKRAIAKRVGTAIEEFAMISHGDRIMVCVSGGKDSYALLDVLIDLQRRAPVKFELIAVNVDQGWPGYRTDRIEQHLKSREIPYRMVDENFAPIVEANIGPGQTPCSLCSRLRRGVLYNLAVELNCSKIALGHHMDDLIETLMLNLFFSGKLASMPPLLHSDDGRNTVIRPLAFVPEDMLSQLSQERVYPVVRCGCPSCGLPNQKRQVVKAWLKDLENATPGTKQQMLAALRNVKPSHLADAGLWRRMATMPADGPKESTGSAFE